MKQNILLVVTTNTYFNELHKVALMLSKSKEFNPIIIFSGSYPTSTRDAKVCLKEKLFCLRPNGERLILPEDFGWYNYWPYRSDDLLPVELVFHKAKISFAENLISKYNISLVIVGGDLVHYDTSHFIKAAHNQGIKAAIIPCTMSDALEMAESYRGRRRYDLSYSFNSFIGKLYPEWVYNHRGHKMLREPHATVIAMKILGISPPLPWINNSGYSDAILAESESMVDYYTKRGIPRSQVVLTGAMSNDVLAENYKNASYLKKDLLKKLKLPNKPIILTALPPDQFYMAKDRPKCDFNSYEKLVEYWVKTLASIKNYNVIVNLHPSVNIKDYEYLEKFGVRLCNDDVASLIPLCDILVASVSCVIRWAIACGKPVINYDVYRLRYTDYDAEKGVIKMEEKEEFENTIYTLTHDKKYYQKIRNYQRKSAPDRGNLDGKTYRRMLGLFNKLINS